MDFLPRQRAEKYQWYKNLATNALTEGPKFNADPAQATLAQESAQAMVDKMDTTNAAENALTRARELERQTEADSETKIRGVVRHWKTLPSFASSGSEAVLRLRGASAAFDPHTYKPKLKVTVLGGQVRIDFEKKGVEGVVIYYRLRGATGWIKLAFDTHSPYFDTAPLQTPGVPEVREYMGRGVIDDVEIGEPSDIVTATFAG